VAINKVGDLEKIIYKLLTLPTELLDGLLPVLICAPESPSEEPRKIYYHADGADDNIKSAEVSDNRRTTRSAGAASSTSSKATAKKSSSSQSQKRPEIHIFSSKSRITEDSDNEIIELPSPDHGTKSRAKKRPLSDSEEVIEVEEAHSKRTSLRPLYDSDSDDKMAAKKAKKNATKKADTSGARIAKKNNKKGAEAVRGRRGGRAGGRGGKASKRAVKSKVIIDSSSSESDLEVPASDPAEAPLAPQPRPKPKPAYKGTDPVAAKTPEIPTSATIAATSSHPLTDVSTYPSAPSAPGAPLASQQVPVLQGTCDIVPATSTYQEQGPLANPIPSATSMQVSSLPPQPLTVASTTFAPSIALQGNVFEGGLLPAGEGPQAHVAWDPRLPYTDSAMQRNSRGYAMHRDPRLDRAGRGPFGLHSRPPGEDGWDVIDHHDNYRNQDRQRGYEDVWDANR
jgi:hypothetical protein